MISKTKVLFIIDRLSTYKLETYHSFVKNAGEDFQRDVEIYHSNESFFIDVIERNKNRYDYYVIIPHFSTNKTRHSSCLLKNTLKKEHKKENVLFSSNHGISHTATLNSPMKLFGWCTGMAVPLELINFKGQILMPH